MTEKAVFTESLKEVTLTISYWGIDGNVNAFDDELAGLTPERHMERVEELLRYVPLDKRNTGKRFLNCRRQVGLMKIEK